MKIKTVLIKHRGASLRINASDFRHGSDELWEGTEEHAKVVEKQVVENLKNREIKTVHKGGGRWIVTIDGAKSHEGTLNKAEAQALAAGS